MPISKLHGCDYSALPRNAHSLIGVSPVLSYQIITLFVSWVMDGPVAAIPMLESVLQAVDLKVAQAYT